MRDELRALADQALSGEDWPGRIARARARRRQRRAAIALSVAVVMAVPVVVLAAGTSTKGGPTALAPTPHTSPSPVRDSVPMSEACPATAEAKHLDAEQPPVTDAFICGEEDVTVPGDGIWMQFTVRRITGGLDALLRVYGTPDEPKPSGTYACTDDLPSPLYVFLHSDGAVSNVRAPRTYCGKPTLAARDAFAALTSEIIWTQKDRQIQTQRSIDTHCTDTYKDIIEMAGEYGVTHHRTTPTPLEGTLTVCRFTVHKEGSDRIGHLDDGTTIDAKAFDDALAQSTVDDSCSTTEHTRFATVHGTRGGWVVVALDGCAVYQDNVGFFRGTDALRALLT